MQVSTTPTLVNLSTEEKHKNICVLYMTGYTQNPDN